MKKWFARLDQPTRIVVTALALVVLMAGSATAALSVNQIWQRIRPKADARYLENTKVIAQGGFLVSPSFGATEIVDCPAGWQALGGGVDLSSQGTNDVDLVYSGPMVAGDNLVAASDGVNPPATGWKVRVYNNSASVSYTFTVGVICSLERSGGE